MFNKTSKTIANLTLSILFLFILNNDIQAQTDTTTYWHFETIDGNEYFGHILSETELDIELKTETIGIIRIKKSIIQIKQRVEAKDIKADGVWLDNEQEGRYFFSPSSYGLKEGEGYYQNSWVLFNQVTYGFTDNFSLGAGTVPLFLFAGTASPFWITPKFSFPNESETFALGGGALLGTVIGFDDSSFGILYGTSTFGSRDQNATFGVGYGFAEGELGDRPTITFSAMTRVGKNSYLITENYLINTGVERIGLISFGGRKVWRNASFDFGGIIPMIDENDSNVWPWISITIPFSQKTKL